jgi:hypothetical protein
MYQAELCMTRVKQTLSAPEFAAISIRRSRFVALMARIREVEERTRKTDGRAFAWSVER